MRGLAITQDNLKNQQEVVKNEVRVNVLNQPYGGFPWLDLPQYANTNWYNAHNFYGDLKDLDAATLDDVQKFFKTYYAPNNAALRRHRRLRSRAQTLAWVKKYFATSRRADAAAARPTSPSRGRRRRSARRKDDELATRPALAFAYHAPPRDTPEYYAMGPRSSEILVQGKDSAALPGARPEERPDRRRQRRDQPSSATCSTSTARCSSTSRSSTTRTSPPTRSSRSWTRRSRSSARRRSTRRRSTARWSRPARTSTTTVERTLRLRQADLLCVLRALRRRPAEDQPDRGRVPQGHARADPEDGAASTCGRPTGRSSWSSRRARPSPSAKPESKSGN